MLILRLGHDELPMFLQTLFIPADLLLAVPSTLCRSRRGAPGLQLRALVRTLSLHRRQGQLQLVHLCRKQR